MALSALDRLTLGYLAASALAFLLKPAAPAYATLLLVAHAAVAGVALLAPCARARGGLAAFLGEFYPLILTVALYTEIGLWNAASGFSHDARVQGWEAAVFGAQVSHDWIRAMPWPALSLLLHLGYLSYYFILAGAPLGLWLAGRREAARRTALAMMATFYVCYLGFLLFPVAGPRYVFPLADNAATRIGVASFTQRLLDNGAAWGTAFPSSHVAVSLVAAVSALRAWRALGAILLPAAVLLTLGTVYGQFHYAVDALAGVLLALVVLAAGSRDRMTRLEGA